MSSAISLRAASADDAATLLQVEQAAFSAYHDLLDPPSSVFRETPATIAAKMQHGQFIVAQHGEQIVGLVFFQREEACVYLGRLSVLPTYQGRGVGKRLIDYVEQQAQSFGPPCVQLYVRKPLTQLQAMYQRLGYQVVEERTHPGYSAPTFVVMEKKVGKN